MITENTCCSKTNVFVRIAFAATLISAASASLSALAVDVAALAVAVNGNDVSVSVPAGRLDDASSLYLVWDVADRGSKLENWPADGATVRVNVGERKTSGRAPLVAWTTPPAGVSFAWPDGVSGKGRLVVKEDGLYVTKGWIIIVR